MFGLWMFLGWTYQNRRGISLPLPYPYFTRQNLMQPIITKTHAQQANDFPFTLAYQHLVVMDPSSLSIHELYPAAERRLVQPIFFVNAYAICCSWPFNLMSHELKTIAWWHVVYIDNMSDKLRWKASVLQIISDRDWACLVASGLLSLGINLPTAIYWANLIFF